MDKILFLGSNSFTGFYFQKFIKDKGLDKEYKFIGTDISDVHNNNFSVSDYIKLNPLDKSELEDVIINLKPNYIINFIGTFSGATYNDYININTNISKNIFDILVENNLEVKKVLLIGSAAEYGIVKDMPIKEDSCNNPVNYYGLSKLFQTHIAKYYHDNYGINVNVLRTFNIIGKGISKSLSIGNFIDKIEKARDGDYITVGNLFPKRDFLHIEDVVEAYWEVLKKGKTGEIYNVCSGKSIAIEDIFLTFVRMSSKKLFPLVDEKLIKKDEIMDIYGDNSKIKNDTNWSPKIDILNDKAYNVF
ncbi:NAD-dependent epimerase/dehydratase family protein [Acetivibrio clariflavus]|uniref:Nucleoside-diphosphate-sugar epimerase n=1 Tax=Acetivibrio clariflavus (strain DSM 19732 / NBRC 101661 / EBR45) TaxID=720554 RepID=G8M377_ACECE|nr:NAD-dependent epimerase/dehydratase family protein [Acetivibrio clariflavus]AEV70397.1 nucleoside-diphosphate-sugar epimerase [Acetivibrio clariflavus DSM 19732]